MNKNKLSSLMLILTSLCIFTLFASAFNSGNVIVLHTQPKAARSNIEQLREFSIVGNVVIQFYADWCNPCKRMSPLVETAARSLSQFTFIRINRDFFMDLAKMYNVTSIPTLIFLRNGNEVGRYDGGPLTQERLERLILQTFGN
jgi:thioredoxin 1